ncbi:hypothetical protein LJB71_13660 [Thermomonas sp. S9]|nr:hypothetical protein [Thermomonas sp. S9]
MISSVVTPSASSARARQRLFQQGPLARSAHRAHGRENAAAGACDLRVAGAVEAHVELVRAVAGEHQVGMAVDQAGRQQAALQVLGVQGIAGRQCVQRADPGDAAGGHRQRAVLDQAERRIAVQGREGGVGQQQVPALGGHRRVPWGACDARLWQRQA